MKINKSLILEFFDELVDNIDGKDAAIAGAGGLAIGGVAAAAGGSQPKTPKPATNYSGSFRSAGNRSAKPSIAYGR